MAANFDIVVLVPAVRRAVERQVGDRGQLRLKRRAGRPLRRLEFRHFRFRFGDLGAKILGGDAILARHRRADLLRGGVAALLGALEGEDRRPALFVERDQRFGARRQPAPPQAFVESLRIIANCFDIVHKLPEFSHTGRPRGELTFRPEPRAIPQGLSRDSR